MLLVEKFRNPKGYSSLKPIKILETKHKRGSSSSWPYPTKQMSSVPVLSFDLKIIDQNRSFEEDNPPKQIQRLCIANKQSSSPIKPWSWIWTDPCYNRYRKINSKSWAGGWMMVTTRRQQWKMMDQFGRGIEEVKEEWAVSTSSI